MNPAGNQLQLRDIHLPESISWWPPAPGWWLLLIMIIAVTTLGVFLYRYRQQRQLHRAAKRELDNIKLAYAKSADTQHLITSLSIWLRRVGLSFYPRIDVAGLTGKAWLDFLDQAFINKNHSSRFSKDIGCALIKAPYQSSADIDAEAMLALCQSWLQCLPRRRSTQA